MEKGILTVIFNNMGTNYYLILHTPSGGWELPKSMVVEGEKSDQSVYRTILQTTGIVGTKVVSKFENPVSLKTTSYDVYLVEANMNIPVVIPKNMGCDTYLWGPYSRVIEKLGEEEKKIVAQLEKVLNAL